MNALTVTPGSQLITAFKFLSISNTAVLLSSGWGGVYMGVSGDWNSPRRPSREVRAVRWCVSFTRATRSSNPPQSGPRTKQPLLDNLNLQEMGSTRFVGFL